MFNAYNRIVIYAQSNRKKKRQKERNERKKKIVENQKHAHAWQ